jgi:hypothetical protein
VRFIHACDIPGVVVRTAGVTIIMTFRSSSSSLAGLAYFACYVRGGLRFSLIIMGIFEIFSVVNKVAKFPPSFSLARSSSRARAFPHDDPASDT